MALGKEIGQFSYKSISSTISAGPGTAMTLETNFEGTGKGPAGEGTDFGTLTLVVEAGATSGTWTWCGVGFLKGGGGVGVRGHGTWQGSGPNKWKYRGTAQDSAGNLSAVESEFDLATRTLTGKSYEWN